MTKETKMILIVVVILVLAYFFMSAQPTPTTTTTGTVTGGSATPGGLPVGTPATSNGAPPIPPASNLPPMSQPAPVSQPAAVSVAAPQSLASDVITPLPVAISGNPAVFSATTSDAETQGTTAQAATPTTTNPLASYPSGFQAWAASLGPNNYAQLLSVLPSMSTTDVNFINNMVLNNLWGQASVAGQWNTFVKTYGFPVGTGFNSFNFGGK